MLCSMLAKRTRFTSGGRDVFLEFDTSRLACTTLPYEPASLYCSLHAPPALELSCTSCVFHNCNYSKKIESSVTYVTRFWHRRRYGVGG